MSEEELLDDTKFWHTNKHDLVYCGFNVLFFKAFLSTKTTKPNGKTCSYPQIRKYFDAILYGAGAANEQLPLRFYSDMDLFLKAFKKQTAKAKKEGNLDKNEADPIPWSLFEVSCMFKFF